MLMINRQGLEFLPHLYNILSFTDTFKEQQLQHYMPVGGDTDMSVVFTAG